MHDVIVVGTDGSVTADVAVKRAAVLAKASGARLELVSGYRESYSPSVGTGLPGSDANEENRKHAHGLLEKAASRLRAEGLAVETHCMRGDPADALIEVAEATEADLIVVGNKGMQGGKRFLLGSVPNKVSHHAPCSVMIVRTS